MFTALKSLLVYWFVLVINDCHGLSMPASRKHLMCILIPSLASELIGYCFIWMVIALKVSCTITRAHVYPGQKNNLQTVGTSFINFSFSSSSGSWVRPWRRLYSSLKGQVTVRAVATLPIFSLGISPEPENEIVVWNLFRRSLPSKGNRHSGIAMKH